MQGLLLESLGNVFQRIHSALPQIGLTFLSVSEAVGTSFHAPTARQRVGHLAHYELKKMKDLELRRWSGAIVALLGGSS